MTIKKDIVLIALEKELRLLEKKYIKARDLSERCVNAGSEIIAVRKEAARILQDIQPGQGLPDEFNALAIRKKTP